MQASVFGACPEPGFIGRVASGRASGVKKGDDGGGSLISTDGVAPMRLSLCLPLLSSLAPQSPEEDFFWHQLTQVVLDKGECLYVHV